MARAIFICKTRISYGNSYGLLNSASFIVRSLQSNGVECKLVSVHDANSVDRVVTEYNPVFVFIEALWITPDKLKEIMSLKRHARRVFVIRLHSRPTFIANEGIAFEWLLGYRRLRLRNLFIAPNNEEFSDDLENIFKTQSVYLPNIYNPPAYEVVEQEFTDPETINVGCFGSVRPMKNHLTQAMAAIKFVKILGRKLNFHINATRMEQHGDQVLRNLRNLFDGQSVDYQLVEHDWLSYKDFVMLVRTMNIGMQVSLSETFNIVAADFVYNQIPFIGSKSISWLPSRFQVEDPNSTEQILDKLEYAYGFTGNLFRNSCNKALERYNRKAVEVWKGFVC